MFSHFIIISSTLLALGMMKSLPNDGAQYGSMVVKTAEKIILDAASEVKGAIEKFQRLVDIVESPQLKLMNTLYKNNENILRGCKINLGTSQSCFDITSDFANITVEMLSGYALVENLCTESINLMQEVVDCQSKSVWKQITCYKDAFQDFQEAVKTYTTDVSQFLGNVSYVTIKFESDIDTCFSKSQHESVVELQKTIELCKLESDKFTIE